MLEFAAFHSWFDIHEAFVLFDEYCSCYGLQPVACVLLFLVE